MPLATANTTKQLNLECMEIWGGNHPFDNAISVPGIDAWVISQPYANNARGGDIHYISTCGGGKISRFAVADVAGHGEVVGQLGDSLRALMLKHINTLDQSRFARTLNQEFSAISPGSRFATAVLTTYFAPTDHLLVCIAGHPAPLWYRSSLKAWKSLKPDNAECVERFSNLPLGVIEPTSFHQFAVPLEKNDLVLLYTDSLIEAESPQGQQLGEAGLLELANGISVQDPDQFGHSLLDAIAHHRDHAPANDDVTLLLLHHNAANPPRYSLGKKIRMMGKMLGLIKV